MADDQHYRFLENATMETWNNWRKDNPDIIPDLSGIDLNKLDISLRKFDFSKSNFRGTTFPQRYPQWELCGIDFSDSDLSNAILKGTDLRDVKFDRSVIEGTDFLECELSPNTSFREVKGARKAKNLIKTRFDKSATTLNKKIEPLYFENCIRAWPEKYLDWERL